MKRQNQRLHLTGIVTLRSQHLQVRRNVGGGQDEQETEYSAVPG